MKRFVAMALIGVGGIVGCRDVVFEEGHRLGDDHVLAGRSASEGADTLTAAERAQGWFVSSDPGLGPLENDLQTKLALSAALNSTLKAYASGQTKVRDPRAASPALTTASSTLASPVVAPVSVADILRKSDTDPGELQALCAHPILKKHIGDGCNGIGNFGDIPMDDLTIEVDAANLQVSWDAPRQVVRTLRPSDPAGECTTNSSGALENRCKEGFACPTNAAGSATAGGCVWAKPCTTSAECVDPTCADWGGCTSPEGHTTGVCSPSQNHCTRYLELDSSLSDRSTTAPVLKVRAPLKLVFDPQDVVGGFIVVNLKELVVDFRLQPSVCTDSSCRTFGRVAFEDYAPNDVVFSTAGVDVRARSAFVSRDYEIIPTPACFLPGAELIVSPFIPVLPPGSAAFSCVFLATDVIPPLIDDALTKAGNSLGPLVDTFLGPSAFVVPSNALPSWLGLDTRRIYFRTTDGRTLPIAGANGAWTDDTLDILANGATHSYLRVDLNDSPVSDACAGPTVPPQCAALCGDRPVPCDLSNAKICLHFHGQTGCDDGLRLRRRDFETLMEQVRTLSGGDEPTDEKIAEMIAQIADATAPIPAVPQLATLLDASPMIAKTFQSVFARPLEDAFGDAARYTDIVYCPATGARPGACPSGVNGPVFKFRVDTDHDGHDDAVDLCPNDPDPDNVNTDGDRWCDGHDVCVWTPSFTNRRSDCDCDVDGDSCNNELTGTPIAGAPLSVPTSCAVGPGGIYDENPDVSDGGENTNAPLDEITNDCDPDDDGDGVPDETDNCPSVSNKSQADRNKDGFGDACDPLCPGPSAPCPLPEHHDPSVLPMGLVDFDFGARLIPGCFADGPGCWGFFRVGCLAYDAGGTCSGGGEILRWLAPTGAMSSFGPMSFDTASFSAIADLTGDGALDLLVSTSGKKQPVLSALDGSTGKALWELPLGTASLSTTVAVGSSFVAAGLPDQGAVQLLSLTGKPLGAPISAPMPNSGFGSSVTFTGGMMLVGAPGKTTGKAKGKPEMGGRLYAVGPASKHPVLLLDGHEVKASIGAGAPVAMTYAGKDVLVVPSEGRALIIERVGKQFGKLGKVIAVLDSGTDAPLSMSAPTDFDGDGVREIAVGVPGYLKSAGTIGFVSEDGTLRQSGLLLESGARLGESVVALGDLNGDGASELGATIPGVNVPDAPFGGSFVVLTRLAKPGPAKQP